MTCEELVEMNSVYLIDLGFALGAIATVVILIIQLRLHLCVN